MVYSIKIWIVSLSNENADVPDVMDSNRKFDVSLDATLLSHPTNLNAVVLSPAVRICRVRALKEKIWTFGCHYWCPGCQRSRCFKVPNVSFTRTFKYKVNRKFIFCRCFRNICLKAFVPIPRVPLQAQIHTGFHCCTEIGRFFIINILLLRKKNTFQVEMWPISRLNDSEIQERGLERVKNPKTFLGEPTSGPLKKLAPLALVQEIGQYLH